MHWPSPYSYGPGETVVKEAPGELLFQTEYSFLPHLVGIVCIEPGVCCILIPACNLSNTALSL